MSNVVIVQDHLKVKDELQQVLRTSADFTFGGLISSDAWALQTIRYKRPDLVLVDFGLIGRPVVECVHQLHSFLPVLPVVVLNVNVGAGPGLLLELLHAGASGILDSRCPPTQILCSNSCLREEWRFPRHSFACLAQSHCYGQG